MSELLQDSGEKQDVDYLLPGKQLRQGQWVGWILKKQSIHVPRVLLEMPTDQLNITGPTVLLYKYPLIS